MKKLLMIVLLLCNGIVLYAQFQSAGQKLIDNALDGSVFLISESYQLKDTLTSQMYGRYGKPEFGIAYSLAVKVRGGYCTKSSLFVPWDGDENYEKYKGKLTPVLHKTSVRNLSDTIWNEISLDKSVIVDVNKELVSVTDSVAFESDGLIICYPDSNRVLSGWIVLFTISEKKNIAEIKETENYIFTRDVDFSSDKPQVLMPTEENQQILLGLFLVAKQTHIGEITFQLMGIVSRDESGWFVQAFPKDTITKVEETNNVAELSVVENNDRKSRGSKKNVKIFDNQ